MYAAIPVYYPSLEEAARKDEAALWCDSYNINMDCRNFIQAKAMTVMNSRELDSFIGELVRFYGVERAIYVLSRTVQFSEWDSLSIRRCLTGPDRPISRTPGRRGMKTMLTQPPGMSRRLIRALQTPSL